MSPPHENAPQAPRLRGDPGTSEPSDEELAGMDREQRMYAGAESDGVHIVHRREQFPVPGTRRERRAERQVAGMFLLTFLGAVGFMVCYVAVPWRFKLGDNNAFRWFTPALGVCLGIALLGLGFGMVLLAKKLMPEEEVVQDRHDGPSSEFDRETTGATIVSAGVDTGLARRKLLTRTIGLGAGALGVMAIFPLGGLIVKPRDKLFHTLWRKGVRLVQVDGTPVRPEDMQPGSLATVFPDVPDGIHDANSPTMLIRLRPGVKPHKYRKGQQDWGWGDYIAFSKICTHLGCPVSLFEQQTNRILCPCHQSQFDVLTDGEPVFGPATRPLPQLPITLDDEGYFVARSDYHEPIGPAFWERPNP